MVIVQMKAPILSTVLLAGVLLNPCAAAERKFTSADGKELVAEMVTATATEVTLKRTSDGKEFTLPLARLSEDDRKFVAAWIEQQKPNMRPAREVELTLEDGSTKKLPVPKGFYLSPDGTLTLYAGDTVHLEFAKDGDKWGAPKVVSEVKNPEQTITFALSQQANMTVLNRTTKIQPTVVMDCMNCEIGSDQFARTGLYPTEKGLAASDSWSGKVWILQLSKFEVTDRPAGEAYEGRVK